MSDLVCPVEYFRPPRDLVCGAFARVMGAGRALPTAILAPTAARFSQLIRIGLDLLRAPSVTVALKEAEATVLQCRAGVP